MPISVYLKRRRPEIAARSSVLPCQGAPCLLGTVPTAQDIGRLGWLPFRGPSPDATVPLRRVQRPASSHAFAFR